MNPLIQLKQAAAVFFVALISFGFLPTMQAVNPPPDGGYPGGNTAEGQTALLSLTGGTYNTAVGFVSLRSNTEGVNNTATGAGALFASTTGAHNCAFGFGALLLNTIGMQNTAVGTTALLNNAEGVNNTAIGVRALKDNTTGSSNTAIGYDAGLNITGDGNVCIGDNAFGEAGVNNTTWIRNVYASGAGARAVYVNSDNKIGTLSSSRRYKDEIRPMEKASEVILSVRPVSFRYKKEVDPTRSLSFGLIAEEVAEVDPDLVTPDRDGKPETVRYEAVNAMLLNEFLKEHRKVQEQNRKIQEQHATITELKSTVAQQQKGLQTVTGRLDEQAAQIQKVSAQLEASKPAPQVVTNP